MRDITRFINRTPFKNDTFKFFTTTKKDDHPGHFYTPYTMTNWLFDDGPTRFSHYNMAMHDICHVIDLWMEGSHDRLLKQDFGWQLQGDEKLPGKYFLRELNVITMQQFLMLRIHGTSSNCNNPYTKRDYRKRTIEPFLPTKKEWEDHTAMLLQKHADVGVLKYLKIWKEACRFVKTNR